MEPTTEPASAPDAATEEPPKGNRIKQLFEEYGAAALITWFSIFGATLAGFRVALEYGYTPEGDLGGLGAWGIAYVGAQVVKPVRIVATVALTPLVASVVGRFRPEEAASEGAGSE